MLPRYLPGLGAIWFLLTIGGQGIGVPARQLTFEERVSAQEAIERVYYSHQLGTTRPFEEVVTRVTLEEKVRAYLKKSAALEKFWMSPVTGEALKREVERIASTSRMPERLTELYEALEEDDPFLISRSASPALY